MASDLILGVDGGGTQTAVVAVRPDGTVLATATGGGINFYNIGMDAAREALFSAVQETLSRCGEPDFDRLVIGMSALDHAADAETVRRFAGSRFASERIDMQSDAYVALMGVTLGAPGLVVICGTGSMLLLLDGKGRQHIRHGWGATVGDAGSAYRLAVEGLRAAIRSWEGMGEATALAGAAMVHFDLARPRDLIERIYAPASSTESIAQFARAVLREAEHGDAVALDIVRENLSYIACLSAKLLQAYPEATRVGLQGGMFLHNPWVCEVFEAMLRTAGVRLPIGLPAYPPEIGAVFHCLQGRGALTPAVIARIRETRALIPPTA